MKKIISIYVGLLLLLSTTIGYAATSFQPTPEMTSTLQKAVMDTQVQKSILNYFKKNKITISKEDLSKLIQAKFANPTPSTNVPADAPSKPSSYTQPLDTPSSSQNQKATAQCKDGTFSYSLTRSGTCSHHGGVSNWL